MPLMSREPFITDSLGGDFKEYIKTHKLDELKDKLYNKLSDSDKSDLDIIINRLQSIPNHTELKNTQSQFRFPNPKPRLIPLLEVEEKPVVKEINSKLNLLSEKYNGLDFEASVGYFCHGLNLLPEHVKAALMDGPVIDIGAYVGDSAISFIEQGAANIHSFDISLNSIEQYKKNMQSCNIDHSKYNISHLAVFNKSGMVFRYADSGSPGQSLERYSGNGTEIEVETITIDDYCRKDNIHPAVIKADMEGHAMDFIMGATETLKSDRPALLIAIYHNPTEFFEIKPYLENLLPDYNFLIKKLDPGIERNACHSEVFLIAYPAQSK